MTEMQSQWMTLRWLTRLHSLVVNSAFLFLLFLALTNEDRPQGPAWVVLAIIGCAILGNFGAWRWEREGGIAVMLTGFVLIGVALWSGLFFIGAQVTTFLVAILLGVPFLVAGTLFWYASQTNHVS